MRPTKGGFVVPAHGTRRLQPGGDHIMLMGVTEAVKPGALIPFTLTLAGGRTLEFTAVGKDFAAPGRTTGPVRTRVTRTWATAASKAWRLRPVTGHPGSGRNCDHFGRGVPGAGRTRPAIAAAGVDFACPPARTPRSSDGIGARRPRGRQVYPSLDGQEVPLHDTDFIFGEEPHHGR
ncbi:copper chaperone PCu(A)C [Streptosporangium lutulentum]